MLEMFSAVDVFVGIKTTSLVTLSLFKHPLSRGKMFIDQDSGTGTR